MGAKKTVGRLSRLGDAYTGRLNDLAQTIKTKTGADVMLRAKPEDGYGRTFVEVDEIWLDPSARGAGAGTEAMQMISDYADQNGLHLVLSADSSVRGAKKSKALDNQLKKFYKQSGFVENKGRNKDFTLGGPTQSNVMYREPHKGRLNMTHAERMKRAAEQGFDTNKVWYHGTANDVKAFDPSRAGSVQRSDWGEGVYLSPDPGSASYYAREAGLANDPTGDALYEAYEQVAKKHGTKPMYEWMDLGSKKDAASQAKYEEIKDAYFKFEKHRDELRQASGAVYPVHVRGEPMKYQYEGITDHTLPMQAAGEGKDWVQVGQWDGDTFNVEEALVMDPSNIRSVNAAFDPANIGKSDILGRADPRLLAATAAAGAGAAALSPEAEAGPMGALSKLKNIPTRVAHHGSPHDFDKFDLAKIGTGEGAQAYGHGLYFTSKEDIAKYYRDQLSKSNVLNKHYEVDGKTVFDKWDSPDREVIAYRMLHRADNDKQSVLQEIDDLLPQAREAAKRTNDFSSVEDWEATRKIVADAGEVKLIKDTPGKLYQVEIPDESLMLDWDAPLSEQPENVREAIWPLLKPREVKKITHERGPVPVPERHGGMVHPEQYLISAKDQHGMMLSAFGDTRDEAWAKLTGPQDLTGMQIHNQLSLDLTGGSRRGLMEGGEEIVSEKLRELGIPGITYKGATSGERNFVVFDDEMINLMEKGFVDPKLLAGMGAAALPAGRLAQRYEQDQLEGWQALGALASTVAGGTVADLSALGGYLRGADVEETKAAAEGLAGRLQYLPEGDNQYLRAMGEEMQQLEEDIEPGMEAWRRSIPGRLYKQLPPRVKGIIESLL